MQKQRHGAQPCRRTVRQDKECESKEENWVGDRSKYSTANNKKGKDEEEGSIQLKTEYPCVVPALWNAMGLGHCRGRLTN